MKELNFEDLSVGMRVVDVDGDRGVIIEIFDNHNIHVEYDEGGAGLYCVDKTCEERDPTEILYEESEYDK